jgi:hypothetical protein
MMRRRSAATKRLGWAAGGCRSAVGEDVRRPGDAIPWPSPALLSGDTDDARRWPFQKRFAALAAAGRGKTGLNSWYMCFPKSTVCELPWGRCPPNRESGIELAGIAGETGIRRLTLGDKTSGNSANASFGTIKDYPKTRQAVPLICECWPFPDNIPRMKTLPVLIVGVALWGQTASTHIEPGYTYQRAVPIGQADVVHFQTVSADQIISLKIVPQTDDELVCRFYAPSGDFRRGFSTHIRINPTFTFFAAEPGDWRLEVSRPGRATTPARYVLSDFGSHAASLAEPRQSGKFESPRLSTIHSPADADTFWKETAAAGTPLIEAIRGEPDERLVTFVWRGSPDTKSVHFVSTWEIENRFLSQLRDTGIWYLSQRVDRRVRATYRFAPNLPALSRMAEDAIEVLAQRDPLNPKIFGAINDNPDEELAELHPGSVVGPYPDRCMGSYGGDRDSLQRAGRLQRASAENQTPDFFYFAGYRRGLILPDRRFG